MRNVVAGGGGRNERQEKNNGAYWNFPCGFGHCGMACFAFYSGARGQGAILCGGYGGVGGKRRQKQRSTFEKGGPEESLEILNDYEHLMNGKEKPGYEKRNFYCLLDEQIRAEQAVLEGLIADPNPDLYDLCLELYTARKEHPLIY